MGFTLLRVIILVGLTSTQAKEPELPLCPSNMQYFPQNLPMHCRLPVSMPTLPPFPPQLFPNPQQAKPGSFPLPLPGLPSPVSGLGPIPGPMPMPMPMMPMPQAPAQKLPVIVMPFYSPDTSYKKNDPLPLPRQKHKKRRRQIKKRRPIHYDSSDDESSSTDTDTSDESPENGWWKKTKEGRRSRHNHKRRKQQNRDLLTPVLQYVTKDGYVIFEKQISKGEAKGWLVKKNEEQDKKEQQENKNDDRDSNEERPEHSFNYRMKGDDTVEMKTEIPQQVHKKKILKRKPIKIIRQQE